MSRYVVTGAAGFVGSHLCESLLADNNAVVGIDSFSDYYSRSLKEANLRSCHEAKAFELVEADLSEYPLARVLDGVDGVFHLAAQAGVRRSWGDSFQIYLRDNVLATQHLFEAALERGLRVVFASSSSIYGDSESYPTTEDLPGRPISPYGVTKLACEHLAHAYSRRDLDVIGLRYFTVYGPRQRPDMAYTRIALALLRNETFTIYGTGEQSRDVTYVGDAVSATRAAMEHGVAGSTYNVGGGSETTLMQAINVFEEACRAQLRVEHISAALGDVKRTAGCTDRLARDTGWQPTTDLIAGVRAHVEWARGSVNTATAT
jgi:UDP-glucuronate 4-epimerase